MVTAFQLFRDLLGQQTVDGLSHRNNLIINFTLYIPIRRMKSLNQIKMDLMLIVSKEITISKLPNNSRHVKLSNYYSKQFFPALTIDCNTFSVPPSASLILHSQYQAQRVLLLLILSLHEIVLIKMSNFTNFHSSLCKQL